MLLEGDLKQLSDNNYQNETMHYEHKIHQDKEKAFDEEAMSRHNLEVKLVTELKTKKTKAKTELDQSQEQIKKDFLAMKEYQDFLAEEKKLREEIEAAKVKI